MAFKISDGAEFIVKEDGERLIKNLSIEPWLNPDKNLRENFDFSSDDPATTVLNSLVLPSIDPSGIGRKVWIDFVDANLLPKTTYTKEDFNNDLETSKSENVSTPEALVKLALLKDEFVDGLFNDDVTRFLDGNKPIVYGTVGNDFLLSAANVSSFTYPTLYKFKNNGVVLIGGEGSDNIIGHLNNDKLLGGEGNDILDGNNGNDLLNGGKGKDTVDGGLGDQDIAVFSDEFKNYTYSISQTGISFTHNLGTQIDGTNKLKNIEFAQFSDRLVPLPLEDGPKNTKQTDIFNDIGLTH